MARPKEPSVSLAFQEKCEVERDKLQQRLAKQLRADMDRLLEEGCHSDMTILLHGDCLKVHSSLIKIRAPGFYTKYIQDNREGVITVEEKDVEGVKLFIKHLYTKDDLSGSSWVGSEENGANNLLLTDNSSHTNGTTAPPVDIPSEENKENSAESANSRPPGDNGGCCELGRDLLSLYFSGANTDVVIEAKGKYFKAHKFILCNRSSYFAAMLGGSWKESESHEIRLEGISPGVMQQALLYMYGGAAELSGVCDVGELVMLADMYGIVGIKEIATFVIKRDYCHFFHKPCSGCISGICETLPLTLTFNLNDIQERCLRWSNKNFVRLWPTKPFALLPKEVLDKCTVHLISDISSMTVLDIIMDTDKLRGAMPQVRWADPVVEATDKVMDACVTYLSSHHVQTFRRDQFLALGSTMAFVLEFLEGVFMQSINSMPVECACKTYIECKGLKERTESENCDWTEGFKSLIQKMYQTCDHYMHQHVHLLVASPDWNLLSNELQTQIKEGGWYVPTNDGSDPKTGPKGSAGAVRPNKLPTKKRPASKSTTSSSKSKTPTPGTPGSASSSRGSRTPRTPGAKRTPTTPRTPDPKAAKPKSPGTLRGPSSSGKPTETSASRTGKTPSPSTSEGTAATIPPREKVNPKKKSPGQGPPQNAKSSGKLPGSGGTSPRAKTSIATSNKDQVKTAGKVDETLETKPGSTPNGVSAVASNAEIANTLVENGSTEQENPDKHQACEGPPNPAATTSQTPADVPKQDISLSNGKHSQAASTSRLPIGKEKRESASAKGNTGKAGITKEKPSARPSSGVPKSKSEASSKKLKQSIPTKTPSAGSSKSQRSLAKTDPKPKLPTELKPATSASQSSTHARTGKSTSSVLPKAKSVASPASSSPRSTASTKLRKTKSPRSAGGSSSSSQVSSPRSSVSGSKLPVVERSATTHKVPDREQRTSRSQINKNNDAVYAKCTSMRIAAMTKIKRVDSDYDIDTESVVSMMSHMAVKGSRTPSIVDIDLWADDLSDIMDGLNNRQQVRVEVNFAPPKTFTDVIIPILEPSMGCPANAAQKER